MVSIEHYSLLIVQRKLLICREGILKSGQINLDYGLQLLITFWNVQGLGNCGFFVSTLPKIVKETVDGT